MVIPFLIRAPPDLAQHDLKTFHLTHFGRLLPPGSLAANPAHFFAQAYEEAGEEEDDDDDGLGYYPDGVKRTLTDEQIAIFRHTEIQTLLRERRKQRAADTQGEPLYPRNLSQGNDSPTMSPEHELSRPVQLESMESGALVESTLKSQSELLPDLDAKAVEYDADTGSEITYSLDSRSPLSVATNTGNPSQRIPRYPNLSNQQRKNMKMRRRHKKKSRQERQERHMRQMNEAKTPRRRAREMDEQEASSASLDYDNGFVHEGQDLRQADASESDGPGHSKTGEGDGICAANSRLKPSREGRNGVFVWPQIKPRDSIADY